MLRAIGALSEKESAALERVTPYLRETFGRPGTWFEIIEAQLHMGDDAQEQLAGMWKRNQERAREMGVSLSAEEFAKMVADANFIDESAT